MMNELMDYIAYLNVKTRRWIAGGPSRYAGMLSEDPAKWAMEGVFTIEDFILDEYRNSYSDFHKEAYGYRPRNDVSDWRIKDFENAFEHFGEVCDANNEERRIDELQAIADFEAKLVSLKDAGAGTRENAIQWIKDAEGDDWYDDGFFEYECGLPYGYLSKVCA